MVGKVRTKMRDDDWAEVLPVCTIHNAGRNCMDDHNYTDTGYVPLESSRRGGRFEYRHAYARAIDMPSAMAGEKKWPLFGAWVRPMRMGTSASRHRRRRVHCAGMDVPVLKLTVSARRSF